MIRTDIQPPLPLRLPERKPPLPQLLLVGGLLGCVLWLIEFLFICRFQDIQSLLWHYRPPVIIQNILGTLTAYFLAGASAALVCWLLSYGGRRRNMRRSLAAFTALSSLVLSLALIFYLRFWLFGHLRITYHRVYLYCNLVFTGLGLICAALLFIGLRRVRPAAARLPLYCALAVLLSCWFVFGSHNNLMFYRFQKATGYPAFSLETAKANAALLVIVLILFALSWVFFRMVIPRIRRLSSGPAWTVLMVVALGGVLLNGFLRAGWQQYIVHASLPLSGELPTGDAKPNILIMIIDAIRADHLGCYGYRRDTSPFIDSLAKRGALFENLSSAGNHTYAHLNTFLSGNGYRRYFYFSHMKKPPVYLPLLPDLLRPAGYRSAAFVATELAEHRDPGFTFLRKLGIGGDLPESALQDFNFKQVFRQAFDAHSTSLTFSNQFWLYKLAERFLHYKTPSYLVRTDRFGTYGRRVLSWIEEDPETPFFIYLHPRGAHHPYFPPLESPRKFFRGDSRDAELANSYLSINVLLNQPSPGDLVAQVVDLYDDMIGYSDTAMRWLVEELEKKGLLENTILIISADHGECFYEHGQPFHHSSLFQEEIHVPLIVFWKGRVAPGLRLQGSFSALDVCPSLLEAAGLPIPEGLMGSSFLRYLSGGKEVPRGRIALSEDSWDYWKDMISAQCWPWKVIACFKDNELTRTWVYNLSDDPGEKHNLSPDALGRTEVGELLERIKAYAAEFPLRQLSSQRKTAEGYPGAAE